jgi:stage III sporulation protein AE
MASESGVLPIPEGRIVRKWRLQPGKMFLIDFEQGRIVDDEELKHQFAFAKPYRQWVDSVRIKLEDFDKYSLSNLAGLFKQAGMTVLGLTLVVFIGIVSIQGVAGSVADGLTLRTAKYATATFIPVVGKMFADTVELVMGASLLIKNSIGIFGVLAIGTICIFPVIKLVSLIIIIKVAGALVQPLGDDKMAKCLDSIGNNLFLVFSALLTTALMCFLAITMIIGVGSVSMMFR